MMDRVGQGNFAVRMDEELPILEFQKISRHFNRMLENICMLMQKNVDIEREKRELEIESLQAQINPHFLFNTLVSIRWIAVMTHVDSIATALAHLNKLLKPLFYDTTNAWTIQEECRYIESYISLMELRFGSQVEFSMQVEKEVLSSSIPRFILQPILENSYEHAGRGQRHTKIRLDIRAVAESIVISIEDDGHGMDCEQLEKIRTHMQLKKRKVSPSGSIGLVNVYRRIKLFYGERSEMSIDSELDQGVKVVITLNA